MTRGLQKIRGWLRRSASFVKEVAEGGLAVATPPPGAPSARMGDPDRETSTNAQLGGAADQPWPGNR